MTPALQIQLALASDSEAIAEMSRSLIEYGLPWSWQPARVARAIASPNTNVAVVREQDKLVGFGIMEYWDDDAHLVLFAVRPASQRQGVGSSILAWLEACAVVAGSKRVRVEARLDSVAARSFYNQHGYHEICLKRRMYSGAADGVNLEKWLRIPNDA
ncbi:MAG: GNAT family N-acetyltransferase [Betaproteobacteria bacterium]|nr:GNAT family N-acetyltransferase [Betaproteobacteria bacterium]